MRVDPVNFNPAIIRRSAVVTTKIISMLQDEHSEVIALATTAAAQIALDACDDLNGGQLNVWANNVRRHADTPQMKAMEKFLRDDK